MNMVAVELNFERFRRPRRGAGDISVWYKRVLGLFFSIFMDFRERVIFDMSFKSGMSIFLYPKPYLSCLAEYPLSLRYPRCGQCWGLFFVMYHWQVNETKSDKPS